MPLSKVNPKHLRYLLVGGWNTLFGYGTMVGLYYLLSSHLHLVVIATIANLLAISMSFTTYKLFVFRSQGKWWHEYLRSYVVYGGNAIFGILGLWLLASGMGMPVWLAQGLLMVFGVVLSYIGHQKFTFRNA
jgi:putative flippase GtrA